VSFAYPGNDIPALNNVSLSVKAGQTVALVGPSGAGKTTLSNLVARFYDPTSGRVTLDGRDLRDYDVESFRSLLGVVEQDVFLFDGTIRQNIAYARRDASESEIRAAAVAANAMEFIDRMSDGLQTVIGERGVRLSGGQRQRLAIARAILADPKLLVLDEATSNLDTESERLIQQSLSLLMRGRTSFVIAHRLSTIAGADLIVVMENGRISQTGTHAELMAQGGRYRTMVEQQIHMTLGSATPVSNTSR
jgi:ATP-binding cassette subfamily B protein/subfamily B ATP-binding cassette protein MsbA